LFSYDTLLGLPPFPTRRSSDLEEATMFKEGLADFSEEESVADGVGPRFNFVSCAGCHAQPATGGTSPAVNPLVARITSDLGFVGDRKSTRLNSSHQIISYAVFC